MAPPAPYNPAGNTDPNALGVAADRLGSNGAKLAKTAIAIASAQIAEGDVVEAVVAGKLEGNGAVLVLSGQGLLLVDDRRWRPVVERIVVEPGLTVEGWQDDRTASLTLRSGGRQLLLDQIPDRPLAVEMAQRIRYRTGEGS